MLRKCSNCSNLGAWEQGYSKSIKLLYVFFPHAVTTPASVSITSNPPSPVSNMSTVAVTCTVELNNSAILESELSMVIVEAQLSGPNEAMLSLSNPMVSGTTFTYATQLNSFERSDSGSYTCTTTIRPQPTATYLTGVGMLSNTIRITVGKVPQ